MCFIPPTARSAPIIRRQYYQAWGRMLNELRRLNEKAVDILDDPELVEVVDHMLTMGESIAVCMVLPDSYELTKTPKMFSDTVSVPHLGRIS